MGLKLKEGIGIEELRKYGFELGGVLKKRDLGGYNFSHDECGLAHKFLMNPDDTTKIAFTDEEFAIPVVHIYFRIGWLYNNSLYIDVAPSCTYHVGGEDLDIIADTIFAMTQAGLLEENKK